MVENCRAAAVAAVAADVDAVGWGGAQISRAK